MKGVNCIRIQRNGTNFSALMDMSYMYTIIDIQLNAITSECFDYVYQYVNGHAKVRRNDKGFNLIDNKGNILSKKWFDDCGNFYEGYTCVYIKNKGWNHINAKGNIISGQWWDKVCSFSDGFARVLDDGKWNYITTRGNLISDRWWDSCYNFTRDGMAYVFRNGIDGYYQYNAINRQGKLIWEWRDERTEI